MSKNAIFLTMTQVGENTACLKKMRANVRVDSKILKIFFVESSKNFTLLSCFDLQFEYLSLFKGAFFQYVTQLGGGSKAVYKICIEILLRGGWGKISALRNQILLPKMSTLFQWCREKTSIFSVIFCWRLYFSNHWLNLQYLWSIFFLNFCLKKKKIYSEKVRRGRNFYRL